MFRATKHAVYLLGAPGGPRCHFPSVKRNNFQIRAAAIQAYCGASA
jgi:hypothetical protein